MVGLSIPFAFMARRKLGESGIQLLSHILIRTLSLILIGVFAVNIESYNADLTGINKFLWAILVYISVFLIWNKYPNESRYALVFKGLKVIRILGLLVLAAIYRSGTPENIGWMSTSWWGILGLIGWGYLVAALTYFWLKDNIGATGSVWVGFILLNVLAQLSYTRFLNPIKPIFGVILNGNTPSIVLAGLVIGILLKKYRTDYKRFLSLIISVGMICIATAFGLRNWFIISKLSGTPS
jgi:hypothetical protein